LNRQQVLLYFVATVFVLLIYSYPALRTRFELRFSKLPPLFAPDLTLYLNLSQSPATASSQFLNPYYLVPVPYDGAGYLKFHLAPALFAGLRTALGGRLWLSVFLWNALWWCGLSIVVVWLLRRFLPWASSGLVVLGLMLLMLFNFGILKTLLIAWAHLPSMARFETIGLPFMRAFVPVMPVTLLVAYLGLQMEALRRGNAILIWVGMGVLQLVALASFPYATLMMAGITAVSAIWQIVFSGNRWAGLVVTIYGVVCAVVDAVFALGGSLGFYGNHSSSIRFQPAVLPHLVGGNWLILAILTTAAIVSKKVSPDVKWPLVGLGATNLVLMLGDAIVPAQTILLSHHAAHFIHSTIAILLIFLLSAALASPQLEPNRWKYHVGIAIACAVSMVALNGLLLSLGTYRGYLTYNRQEAALAQTLAGPFRPLQGDLVIARAQVVDDQCGWIFLLTQSQVLYCTDAEVMLTVRQNVDIHRFRQAIYLYLTGRDSNWLRRMLAGPTRLNVMYGLGYWAEAASHSRSEQADGVLAVEHELIPLLEKIEQRDDGVGRFFQQFRRIVVVDNQEDPTFSQERMMSFLKLESEQQTGQLECRIYTPRK